MIDILFCQVCAAHVFVSSFRRTFPAGCTLGWLAGWPIGFGTLASDAVNYCSLLAKRPPLQPSHHTHSLLSPMIFVACLLQKLQRFIAVFRSGGKKTGTRLGCASRYRSQSYSVTGLLWTDASITLTSNHQGGWIIASKSGTEMGHRRHIPPSLCPLPFCSCPIPFEVQVDARRFDLTRRLVRNIRLVYFSL